MADVISFETALKALNFDSVTFPQTIPLEEYLDTRIVERKKPGKRKARRSPQFSKR